MTRPCAISIGGCVMRWIAVANRCEFLDDAVMPDSSAGERSSHHGLLPQTHFGDRNRRG